jgi:hypothetical protein
MLETGSLLETKICSSVFTLKSRYLGKTEILNFNRTFGGLDPTRGFVVSFIGEPVVDVSFSSIIPLGGTV